MLKYFKFLFLLLFITPVYADGLFVPPPKLPLSVVNGGTGVTTSTGSGNNVLSVSPTLTTPVLGAATATTINGAAIDNNAWTTFNTVVTCDTGAPSYTSSGSYKVIGKTVFYNTQVIISSISTCTGNMRLTLPVTAITSVSYPGSGYIANSGTSVLYAVSNTSGVMIGTVSVATYYFNVVYQAQ